MRPVRNILDDIRVRRKRDIFRNNLRRKNKLNPLYDQPEKNFLEVKSTHIYNPSIAYRDFFDNNAMGTSTIYYSRLMWGGVIFLIMFILVSSIGVYLYVNNLEGNYPKKRHDLSRGGALNGRCSHHLREKMGERAKKKKKNGTQLEAEAVRRGKVAKLRQAPCEVVDSTG
ncbi:conserved Plasmodium protein, unknown function [Plasmodium ovale curtisi]|uniref:Uncharacterized protein n=1 Tax=Plasmodium ovale curtisi TaxID=864141 RepID=A0A1A8VM19_PLAOA|nr:conserved Plasmodium protein, unknown function [Plasmodium ovale curtisi]